MLNPPQYSPDLLVDKPVPKYVIEITLPDIEYLKSAVAVESDKPKVISLRSFIREFQLNCPVHTLSSKLCSFEHNNRKLKTLL